MTKEYLCPKFKTRTVRISGQSVKWRYCRSCKTIHSKKNCIIEEQETIRSENNE